MRSAALFLAVVFLGLPQVAPIDIDPPTRAVLARELKFSAADFSELARGKTVRRTLEGGPTGEIAAVGAVQIDAPIDRFLTEFRDIVSFKRNDDVLQIGRFSDPPKFEDLGQLTVDADDMNGRNCRVGDCDVRLPASDLVRFQRDIDWTSKDATGQAADLYKHMLFDHVQAYWTGGPGRITAYEDDKRPIQPAVQFAAILKDSPYVGRLVAGLPPHLADFPATHLAGAEDFLYWSKEKFGIAPFITVTHVTLTHTLSGTAIITSKDVYSSRYFDSSLGLTIAAKDSQKGFLLVYMNQSRANALKGFLSTLRRAMVERRAKASIEESLRTLKTKLELEH